MKTLIPIFLAVIIALGFCAVPVQAAADAPQACESPYIAQLGDSLRTVAEQCGFSYESLLYANPDIGVFGELQEGQQVYLPQVSAPEVQQPIPVTGSPESQVESQAQPAEMSAAAQVHVVSRGDTLARIARANNLSLSTLLLANPEVYNPNVIYVGQRIVLPGPEDIQRLQSEAERIRAQQQQEIAQAVGVGEGRWIDVDLASQTVRAYEGSTLLKTFLVSTGTASYPTVTGQYPIWTKLRYDDMKGPGYYLKDVPYVMYFYKGYGLHGTYWHHNFGTPMSHGCVNLRTEDAAWLYNWASVGTLVNVH